MQSANAIQAPFASQQPSLQPAGKRFDMYAQIHKALRAWMFDTLTLLGRTDWTDGSDADAALTRLGELLDMCQVHLDDENRFVHPAIEARCPGGSGRIAGEHLHHEQEIASLRRTSAEVAACRGIERAAAGHRLYLAMALFVSENLAHMHYEETAHNAALWAAYDDDELLAIETELVASIPPEAIQAVLPWMLGNSNHAERVSMLQGMRASAPPEAFGAVIELAAARLAPREWSKLAQALGLPRVQAA